jgi:hypothetical protein
MCFGKITVSPILVSLSMQRGRRTPLSSVRALFPAHISPLLDLARPRPAAAPHAQPCVLVPHL